MNIAAPPLLHGNHTSPLCWVYIVQAKLGFNHAPKLSRCSHVEKEGGPPTFGPACPKLPTMLAHPYCFSMDKARLVQRKNPLGYGLGSQSNSCATPTRQCTLAARLVSCLAELKRTTTTTFPLLLASPARHSQLSCSCSAVPNTNSCTATSYYIKDISGLNQRGSWIRNVPVHHVPLLTCSQSAAPQNAWSSRVISEPSSIDLFFFLSSSIDLLFQCCSSPLVCLSLSEFVFPSLPLHTRSNIIM